MSFAVHATFLEVLLRHGRDIIDIIIKTCLLKKFSFICVIYKLFVTHNKLISVLNIN